MFALLLSKLISPKGILIFIIVLIVGFLLWEGVKFCEHYVALEKQNVALQQNLTITNNALNQEKKTAATQQQIDNVSLNSVRTVTTQQAANTLNFQLDTTALQAIGTPTNEDDQCVKSPYVSAILERLRDRAAGTPDSGSTSTNNASATNGINKSTSSTGNTSK